MINRNFFSSEKSRIIVSDRFIPVRNPENSQRETLKFLLESGKKTQLSIPEGSLSRDGSWVHSVEKPSVSDLLIKDCLDMSGQKLFTFSKTPKQQRVSRIYQGLSNKAWMPSGAKPGCLCLFATAKKLGCGAIGCRLVEKKPPKAFSVKDLPLKILDAPGMTDDFYLDVLDWARDGSVVLGIEDKVFMYKFPEGVTSEVADLNKLSRQWMEQQVIYEENEDANEHEEPPTYAAIEVEKDGIEEEDIVPEFCLSTPVKEKAAVEQVTTRDSEQEPSPNPSDVLYLSFEDSEFSEESQSSQVSPVEAKTPPNHKKRISFKIENFGDAVRTPQKKHKTRQFSIFEKEEERVQRKRLDSLDAIGKLNFDGLLDGAEEPERPVVVKKRLFEDDEGPNEVPDLDFESEDESEASLFSLSVREEKNESRGSEESEFDDNHPHNFQENNPFLRCSNMLEYANLPEPPQLHSPVPDSPNDFLMTQVNTIVNDNFLESPEAPVDEQIPPPRASQVAPRLSTRESMLRRKNQVIITKFNASGKLLAIADARGNLYILEINTGRIVHRQYFRSKVSALSWNGDKVLAVGESSGNLVLLSLDRPPTSPLLSIQMHRSEIIKIAFSQNGTYLATSGADKEVLGLDLGRLRHHFYSLRGSFLQNLPELASLSEADIIRLTVLPSMSKALCFHPLNPRYLVVGGGVDDQKIRLFDVVLRKLMIKVHAGSQVCSVAFDVDGKTLISSHGFSENVIKLWDLNLLGKRLTTVKVLSGHAERVLYLSVSPCGKFIVSGSGDETLRIWECFRQEAPSRLGKSSRNNFMKRGISGMR